MKVFAIARIVAFSALFACVTLAQRSEAGVLYSQPPEVGSGSFTTYTSAYTDSFLNYFQSLDNFQISSNNAISSLSWQGMYLNFDPTNGYSNGVPNTNNWVISLYTFGGPSSFPFTLYASETVAASAVTETLAGTTTFEGKTVDYYNESLTLPALMPIAGGQLYYLSIFSDNGGSTDSWSWMSGTGGDGNSYQYNSSDNSSNGVNGDRTFTLFDSAVPEPSSVLLLLMGGAFPTAVCTCRILRKRRSSFDGARG
jgi:hypothetical protein